MAWVGPRPFSPRRVDGRSLAGSDTADGFCDLSIQLCGSDFAIYFDSCAGLGTLDSARRVLISILIFFLALLDSFWFISSNRSTFTIPLLLICFQSFLPLLPSSVLYWMRWWVLHSPRTWFDQIGVRTMNWRHYAILFVIGLIVPFAVSRFQSLPGYMDADYYFAGGVQLAEVMVSPSLIFGIIWMTLQACLILPHLLDAARLDCFCALGCGSPVNQRTPPDAFRSFSFRPVCRY